MSRRSGTDGSLLASLPWTLAALTFSLLPHVGYLPPWITGTFFACAIGRWQMERKRWRLPPTWLRVVLSLSCFIGVFASYESISGVGPGSALLAVMAALKLLETRQRRDQFVLLFISIFLIMASLLRDQYIWSMPFLLVGLGIIMTAWLRMSTAAAEPARRTFATAGRLLVYAVPLAFAMWIFFPRIAAPFWSVPIDTSKGVTGLSDHMSPGDISSLSLSDAVAFRARFEDAAPVPSQRYWRGLVLQRFDGRAWSAAEPTPDKEARGEIEVYGDSIRYEIAMEPTQQRWIYALDIPYEWKADNKTFMGSQQQLARMQAVDQRMAYSAVSYPQYRIGSRLSDWQRSRNLRLGNANPRTAELARRMRRAAGSDPAFVESVLGMFHDEAYFYTLEPPPLGRNPVDRFLFDTRRGFCEHYASAFAVMMRAGGVPSRIVLGYQGGEINPVGEYMIVRQSDAHAWTEVWLSGRGWVRIDPTAAVAPERIESGMSGARRSGVGARWGIAGQSRILHRLGLTWDALNARWNEWILGYGPENQGRFLQWLGMERPTWRKMMLTLVAVLAVMFAVMGFLMLRRYRPPKKDSAARLYRRFTRKAGVEPVPGESPGSYARRLATANVASLRDVERVTEHYLAARYGPPDPASLSSLEAAIDRFTVARR